MKYVVRNGKVVPKVDTPPRARSKRYLSISARVTADRDFVCRSQPRRDPRAKAAGAYFNKAGQPVYRSQKAVREYCARASDSDTVEVTYGTD